jgi:hypothetical protein
MQGKRSDNSPPVPFYKRYSLWIYPGFQSDQQPVHLQWPDSLRYFTYNLAECPILQLAGDQPLFFIVTNCPGYFFILRQLASIQIRMAKEWQYPASKLLFAQKTTGSGV